MADASEVVVNGLGEPTESQVEEITFHKYPLPLSYHSSFVKNQASDELIDSSELSAETCSSKFPGLNYFF